LLSTKCDHHGITVLTAKTGECHYCHEIVPLECYINETGHKFYHSVIPPEERTDVHPANRGWQLIAPNLWQAPARAPGQEDASVR